MLKYEEKEFFCHQKQYNFGASRLREKELTKEKMSYVSWHANILELHQACLKQYWYDTPLLCPNDWFSLLVQKEQGKKKGKESTAKKSREVSQRLPLLFSSKRAEE